MTSATKFRVDLGWKIFSMANKIKDMMQAIKQNVKSEGIFSMPSDLPFIVTGLQFGSKIK